MQPYPWKEKKSGSFFLWPLFLDFLTFTHEDLLQYLISQNSPYHQYCRTHPNKKEGLTVSARVLIKEGRLWLSQRRSTFLVWNGLVPFKTIRFTEAVSFSEWKWKKYSKSTPWKNILLTNYIYKLIFREDFVFLCNFINISRQVVKKRFVFSSVSYKITCEHVFVYFFYWSHGIHDVFHKEATSSHKVVKIKLFLYNGLFCSC